MKNTLKNNAQIQIFLDQKIEYRGQSDRGQNYQGQSDQGVNARGTKWLGTKCRVTTKFSRDLCDIRRQSLKVLFYFMIEDLFNQEIVPWLWARRMHISVMDGGRVEHTPAAKRLDN
jgi:hypothetical protein